MFLTEQIIQDIKLRQNPLIPPHELCNLYIRFNWRFLPCFHIAFTKTSLILIELVQFFQYAIISISVHIQQRSDHPYPIWQFSFGFAKRRLHFHECPLCQEYVFIDTAGLRRKNKIKEELERYSIIRTVTAVERADVVLMVIDAVEGVTEQDAKIAGIAHERGKGIIIVVNKWDAVEKNDRTMREYEAEVRRVLSYMPYAEILFVSALTGQRLVKLFDRIDMVIENQTMRVATGVLNEIMAEAVAMQQPPSDKGKRLKLFYITQVAVKPPTFVIFVNDRELMHFSYTRYLENKIREAFGFRGTSLKFLIRERKEKDQI